MRWWICLELKKYPIKLKLLSNKVCMGVTFNTSTHCIRINDTQASEFYTWQVLQQCQSLVLPDFDFVCFVCLFVFVCMFVLVSLIVLGKHGFNIPHFLQISIIFSFILSFHPKLSSFLALSTWEGPVYTNGAKYVLG